MNFNTSVIRQRLLNALNASEDDYGSAENLRDIAFHMTDWLSDLKEWVKFCQNPAALSDDEVIDVLIGFLCHVPEHVAAAAKLSIDQPVRDIFDIGAVEIMKNDNE
ncbi:MAG: hypothetical protein F6J87_16090 [Spirulina sp. SIO3F2]|nr:hypothetical protein [Spirulina sp. SIO3F2]